MRVETFVFLSIFICVSGSWFEEVVLAWGGVTAWDYMLAGVASVVRFVYLALATD